MARIYQPLQRQSDKRWDMTVGSDEEGWTHAIGYCAGWRGDPDEEEKARTAKALGDHFEKQLAAEWDRKRPHKDKFHADGHATSAEARACYREYELDHELRSFESTSEQHKCAVCDAWTPHVAELGLHRFFHLCSEHATREHVKALAEKLR